jgi:hypothetical protein
MKNDPSVKIGYDEPKPPQADNPESLRWTEIIGKIRRAPSQPIDIPNGKLEQQIRIWHSGTELNLCIYDYEAAAWYYLKLSATHF